MRLTKLTKPNRQKSTKPKKKPDCVATTHPAQNSRSNSYCGAHLNLKPNCLTVPKVYDRNLLKFSQPVAFAIAETALDNAALRAEFFRRLREHSGCKNFPQATGSRRFWPRCR